MELREPLLAATMVSMRFTTTGADADEAVTIWRVAEETTGAGADRAVTSVDEDVVVVVVAMDSEVDAVEAIEAVRGEVVAGAALLLRPSKLISTSLITRSEPWRDASADTVLHHQEDLG